MVAPLTPPANNFVRITRKIYNPLGFQKGYNFVLWFIFAGALMGFVLAKLQYLDIPGVFCGPSNGISHAAPGECYYYDNFDVEKIGIRLHLYTILPAAFLVCFQFTPVIRHKFILFHRLNGYLIILLSLVANVGALMIARHAFGGTLSTQLWVGFVVVITTLGLFNAFYNIKRLQIDQHRAWMLRTWFYFSSIITLRIIMMIMSIIISKIGGYTFIQPCAKVAQIFNNSNTTLLKLYPACSAFATGVNPNAETIVTANWSGNAAEIATSLNMVFGVSGWLATALHALGVEIYLHLTPREHERLRNVSYQRQLEAGFKNAGNAGFTPQRLGDANHFRFEALEKTHRGSDTTLAPENIVQEEHGIASKAVDQA